MGVGCHIQTGEIVNASRGAHPPQKNSRHKREAAGRRISAPPTKADARCASVLPSGHAAPRYLKGTIGEARIVRGRPLNKRIMQAIFAGGIPMANRQDPVDAARALARFHRHCWPSLSRRKR